MESEPGVFELKVYDLASERWLMATLPCVCGVRFDVSAFFGHKAQTEARIATTLPDADERTRGRIARKLGPALMTRPPPHEWVTGVGFIARSCDT